MKEPLDHRNYARDKRSVPIHVNLPDGCYVFVRDVEGTVFVLPDAPHLHPKVLGHGSPAKYAGDLTKLGHVIKELTNLSGTFQFDDAEGLLEVVATLESLGFTIEPGAVRLFSHTDGRRPKIIR